MDSAITHPTEHDFYLLSHAGIQGTSRPAHYHVLMDQSQFDADVIQTFTHHLTHTFCRCALTSGLGAWQEGCLAIPADVPSREGGAGVRVACP